MGVWRQGGTSGTLIVLDSPPGPIVTFLNKVSWWLRLQKEVIEQVRWP